jgi:hypothetical protein
VVASEGGWVCACVCVWGGGGRRVAVRGKTKLLGYRMCVCVGVCVCVCVCVGVCLWVGVGASWQATRDPGPRTSSGLLCQQFKRSKRRHSNYIKAFVLVKPMSEGTESQR